MFNPISMLGTLALCFICIGCTAEKDRIVEGEPAPKFTLPTINGEEISLDDVIAENEFVLVDFWSIYCAPCIARFPPLREIYAEYKDYGFEIITIAGENSREDWEQGTEENELPWIDVGDMEDGEMKGWDGPTVQAYGVHLTGMPRLFLIDSNGIVVKEMPTKDELLKELKPLRDDSESTDVESTPTRELKES